MHPHWPRSKFLKALADARLYAFVDTAYLHGRAPEAVMRRLCEGGADIIQLRAKGLPLDVVRGMASAILPISRDAGVPLVINDHLSLAREAGAPCCHLGQEDFFDAGFTRLSQILQSEEEARMSIGLSTHAPDQCGRAMAAGADYIAVGPVFATATKPAAKAVTLDYVRWAAANIDRPWFAIGGITLANVDQVLSAGARRICVVSAILNSPDVADACHAFKKRLLSASS